MAEILLMHDAAEFPCACCSADWMNSVARLMQLHLAPKCPDIQWFWWLDGGSGERFILKKLF